MRTRCTWKTSPSDGVGSRPMTRARKASRPTPEPPAPSRTPSRTRRRPQNTDDRAALAELGNLHFGLTRWHQVREQHQVRRNNAEQARVASDEMIARATRECAMLAREIAVRETQMAAHDPVALDGMIRRRITEWAAARSEMEWQTLNVAVARNLAELEPRLLALTSTFAEVIGRYPKIGDTLELLLDELFSCYRLDRIATTESIPNAAALYAAFQKCAVFLEGATMSFSLPIASRLNLVHERIRTQPLSWADGIKVSHSEALHVRWLLHVAGLLGYRPSDLAQKIPAALLDPEYIAREVYSVSLGCALIADALQHDGIVPTNDIDVFRGGAADLLTQFMHKQTGRWLYETVGVLMRGTLPRLTQGWGRDAKLEPHVRATLKAHRQRAAASEQDGKPSIRKERANEPFYFTLPRR